MIIYLYRKNYNKHTFLSYIRRLINRQQLQYYSKHNFNLQQEGEQHEGSSGGEDEGMEGEALSFVKVESAEGELSEGERGREDEADNAMEDCDSGPDDGDNEGALQIVSGSEHEDEEEDGSGDDVSNPNRYTISN